MGEINSNNLVKQDSDTDYNGMIIQKASFTIYDMKYEEAWLNSLAAEGLMLRKVTGGIGGRKFHFQKIDMPNLRYSIIPKELDEISAEEQELYRKAGWLPVCEKGYTYYYTDDPDAEELFSDEDSYREYNRKRYKHTLRDAVFYILLAAIWVLNFGIRFSGTTGLESIADDTMLSWASYLLVAACIVVYAVIYAAYLIKRRREYKSGNYTRDLSNVMRHMKVYNAIMTVLGVITVISLVMAFWPDKTSVVSSEALENEWDRPVLMRKAFPDEWGFVSERIGSNGKEDIIPAENGHGRVRVRIKYGYNIQKTSNFFLNEGRIESVYLDLTSVSPMDTKEDEEPDKATEDFMDEIIDSIDSDAPEYVSLYYDFRSEDRAIKMLTREIENELQTLVKNEGALKGTDGFKEAGALNGENAVKFAEDEIIRAIALKSEEDAFKSLNAEKLGVDYAGFIDERRLSRGANGDANSSASAETNSDASTSTSAGADTNTDANDRKLQYLYLRKGTKLVYAAYSGEHDLIDKLPLYLAQLQ